MKIKENQKFYQNIGDELFLNKKCAIKIENKSIEPVRTRKKRKATERPFFVELGIVSGSYRENSV